MNRAETASARHHTYRLFSRLFLHSLTFDLLPHLTQLPALAQVLPEKLEPDEAAAMHYKIFAYDIFPYESIYRDPSGLLGGAYTESVRKFYQLADVNLLNDEDHIGQELLFLATLCDREAEALHAHDQKTLARLTQLQYTFLRDHLLGWLPPFVIALSFSVSRFYAILGQLTLSLVYDHWLSLHHLGMTHISGHDVTSMEPQLLELLRDNETNLKRITSLLITPPLSGIYLGRETIAELARKCQLPRGFGSRQQTLSNLFHSAAHYQMISDLLEAIIETCNSWRDLYQQQMASFPEIKSHIENWLHLANDTSRGIATMRDRYATEKLLP